MATLLFIQAFRGGQAAGLPYDAVIELLQGYAQIGQGPVGDAEVTFAPDAIAHYGLVVGDAEEGAQCIALVRPRYDDALRRLVFELMTRFGAAVFDDTLAGAYVADDSNELPMPLMQACTAGVQRISSPQQLWPAALSFPVPMPEERPALRFTNPHPHGANFLLFDWMETEKQHLHMRLNIRTPACNYGTLRALRNVLFKVDTALADNPGFQASFHFADPEANLRLLESPKIADARVRTTMVVAGEALLGAPVSGPPFIADADFFFRGRQQAAECRRAALAQFEITIAPGLAGMAALDQLLYLLHQKMARERAGHASTEDLYSADLQRWAMLAGACLGETIRTEIGGQWGTVEMLDRKHPVVRTHTGRNCWPARVAFNRLMNGNGESLASYTDHLARNAKSPTPRNADIAADIPLLCHILLGRSQFAGGGLPLQTQVPVAQLDYSLDSLHSLDRWLAAVHAQRATLPNQMLSNLCLAAGAYLGEVVRRSVPRQWSWTNYDDFFRNRQAAATLEKSATTCALLIGPEMAALPMQTVNVGGWGPTPQSVHTHALEWLGKPAVKAPAAPTAPAPAAPASTAATPAPTTPAPAIPSATSPARAAPAKAGAGAAQLAIATDAEDATIPWDSSDDADANSLDIDIRARVAALAPEERGYVDVKLPPWIKQDPLRKLVDDYPRLLDSGRVVWAHLVQANNVLFAPGPSDAPGEIVYDPSGRLSPDELGPIAQSLFKLKNTRPADLQEMAIARHLTAEISRAFAMPVPATIAPSGLLLSTVLIFRQHLPNRRLSLGYFPVLISDACEGSVMILPGRWWPRAFAEEWGIEEEAPAKPARVEPPDVIASKDQVLHVVKSPVPTVDQAAWAHLDKLLANEQAWHLNRNKSGLSRLFARKSEAEARLPDPLFSKYVGSMVKAHPGVCEMPQDLGGKVLTLVVASSSVNYVVETARREFGLTVFDANHMNIVYRPAAK